MKNFAINLQNCLFAGASLVVLLSFWLQSKIKILNTSNKSVGGSPVILRDQGINASTCCGAKVPQFLLSLPTSSVPQCEVNIEEEMKEPYVLAFRSHFDLEEVSNEKLATAIRYLNTLRGGKSYLVQVVIQLICQIYRHIICYLSEFQNYQWKLYVENTVTNYMTYLFYMCDSNYAQPNPHTKHYKYILRLSLTWSGYHAIKIAIHKPIKNFIIFFETYLL